MKTLATLLTFALAACLLPATADAASLVATYEFTNSLAADQGGVPALTPVDPLAQNGFLVDTNVFGQTDTVYRFSGTPPQNAGLSLNTTGLVAPTSYSAELVFSFDNLTGFRRVIDVFDRTSDTGFYVDPNNHLTVFPTSGTGPNTFTAGYHHVILTVASNGTVKGYIDGLSDFSTTTTVMNLSNSATKTMNLFLDNVTGNSAGEFSSGKIAQFRLYDGVLTDAEALALSQTPIVPEPASLALLALSLPALLGRARLRGSLSPRR